MSPIASLGRRDWDFDTEDSAAFGEELRLRAEKLKEEKTMSTPTENMLRHQLKELELVIICAQDIVNAWPELTMRKLGEMSKRVDTLRQALIAAGK